MSFYDDETYTQEQIQNMVQSYIDLYNLAEYRATQYLKAVNQSKGIAQSIDFENGNTIFHFNEPAVPSYSVRYEESWAYGGHDEYSREIPMSMLWAPEETIARAKEIREREVQRLLDIQADEERKSVIAREEYERKEFRRLQKKFRGNK